MINWEDPNDHITSNFTVKEALYLPRWGRLANTGDGLNDDIKQNLIILFNKMELVRTTCGKYPIVVHCSYRPQFYNKLVKGALKSAHLSGSACDFHVVGFESNNGCDIIRSIIYPKLEEFNIRMEDIDDLEVRNWLHIDFKEPNPNRFFEP